MSENERPNIGHLFSTWSRATFHPGALYAGDQPERRRSSPLVFALSVSVFAGFVVGHVERGMSGAIGALVPSLIVTIFWVYATAALVHVGLIVFRGFNGAFRGTVAAVCYASAPLVFGVVPVLGTVIGAVWYLVGLAIGLTHAHRVTPRRAWAATILGAGTAMPLLLALPMRVAAVDAFKIGSDGMSPSIMAGEHLFTEKVSYGPFIPWTDARLYSGLPPRRGEVMVFKFPDDKRQDFIMRAIALPGDTLEAVNGRPVLDGWLVPHCYVGALRYEFGTAAELFVEFLGDRDYLTLFDVNPDKQPCSDNNACGPELTCRGGICGKLEGPYKVAPDKVWVMSDNRNHIHDSRSWRGGLGAGVPFENIKGRASFVWMSFGPDGGVRRDRLFVSMNERPVLPASNGGLEGALAKCLSERPPVAATTPPRGQR